MQLNNNNQICKSPPVFSVEDYSKPPESSTLVRIARKRSDQKMISLNQITNS